MFSDVTGEIVDVTSASKLTDSPASNDAATRRQQWSEVTGYSAVTLLHVMCSSRKHPRPNFHGHTGLGLQPSSFQEFQFSFAFSFYTFETSLHLI